MGKEYRNKGNVIYFIESYLYTPQPVHVSCIPLKTITFPLPIILSLILKNIYKILHWAITLQTISLQSLYHFIVEW